MVYFHPIVLVTPSKSSDKILNSISLEGGKEDDLVDMDNSTPPRSKLLGNASNGDIENDSTTEDDEGDPDESYSWEDVGAGSSRRKRKAKKNRYDIQSFKKSDKKVTPKQKKSRCSKIVHDNIVENLSYKLNND